MDSLNELEEYCEDLMPVAFEIPTKQRSYKWLLDLARLVPGGLDWVVPLDHTSREAVVVHPRSKNKKRKAKQIPKITRQGSKMDAQAMKLDPNEAVVIHIALPTPILVRRSHCRILIPSLLREMKMTRKQPLFIMTLGARKMLKHS